MDRNPSPLWLFATLFILCAAGLWARPLLPIDETRYAAVAWEMHSTGQWLVPHINGEPYSHKPPLLFWLINLGWWVLGVHEWLPRLVCALIAASNLILLRQLAKGLWPARPDIQHRAPWLLLGCLTIAVMSTVLMFDLLMSACVLTALIGLVQAARTPRWRHWALFGVGIGLGLLAKGPAVLLYVLPCALLGPWWQPALAKRRWYAGVTLGLLAGVAIGLAWALPAAAAGGAEYRQMLLWGQTAGRMNDAFAHARPWWWYLPMLPLMLLPWTLWRPLWQGAANLWRNAGDGERFCVAWFVPGLLGFSLVSGKQVHYLVPLLPALALLGARCLCGARAASRQDHRLALLPMALAAVALTAAPALGLGPQWLSGLSPMIGAALIVLVLLGLPWLRGPRPEPRLAALAVVFLAVAQAVILPRVVPDQTYPGLDAALASADRQGRAIALSANFRDQYPFGVRLSRPARLLAPGEEITWAANHPDDLLLLEQRDFSPQIQARAEFTQPVGKRAYNLWRGALLADHPQWAGARPLAPSPQITQQE